MLIIETYYVPGNFQLKLKKSWDGTFYWECGAEWRFQRGFGHPQPGRHQWVVDGDSLHQTSPGVIVCHYPITMENQVLAKLKVANTAPEKALT